MRSAGASQAEDIDPGLLNLTVVITDQGITIRKLPAVLQPTVYYQEEVEYRSKSDRSMFSGRFTSKGKRLFHPRMEGSCLRLKKKPFS